MKIISLVLVFIMGLAVASFAGGPMSISEASVSSSIAPEKKVSVDYASDDFDKISKHWTIGIGLGGNQLIGIVEKDGYGYPTCDYGLSCLLGFGYTWYSGQPSDKQITQALASIKDKNGALVNEKDLASLVRKETGITYLDYFEIGTVALLIPANIEMGKMWILNDNLRTRLGFGLPTLLSFGINYDF
jgi:hypothetical protein